MANQNTIEIPWVKISPELGSQVLTYFKEQLANGLTYPKRRPPREIQFSDLTYLPKALSLPPPLKSRLNDLLLSEVPRSIFANWVDYSGQICTFGARILGIQPIYPQPPPRCLLVFTGEKRVFQDPDFSGVVNELVVPHINYLLPLASFPQFRIGNY